MQPLFVLVPGRSNQCSDTRLTSLFHFLWRDYTAYMQAPCYAWPSDLLPTAGARRDQGSSLIDSLVHRVIHRSMRNIPIRL